MISPEVETRHKGRMEKWWKPDARGERKNFVGNIYDYKTTFETNNIEIHHFGNITIFLQYFVATPDRTNDRWNT